MRTAQYGKKGKGMKLAYMLATAVALTTISCGDGAATMSQSSGKPYEVLVLGDRDSTIYKVLEHDVAGLPQPEPSFDISLVGGKEMTETEKLARAIVEVDVDSTLYAETRMEYKRNAYARPQIVVLITSPSAYALKAAMNKNGKRLRSLLTEFEMETEIAALKKRHNAEAEKKIKDMFGVEMLVPADMLSSKSGKDFIWLSNNANSGMQNICIYTSTNANITQARDSVMKANIPGEREGMFMKTATGTVMTENRKDRKGQEMLVARGLWEMENDAMGGPFVLHRIRKGGKFLYVEGFVYAPESRKRNKMRQTEAALYTLDCIQTGLHKDEK